MDFNSQKPGVAVWCLSPYSNNNNSTAMTNQKAPAETEQQQMSR